MASRSDRMLRPQHDHRFYEHHGHDSAHHLIPLPHACLIMSGSLPTPINPWLNPPPPPLAPGDEGEAVQQLQSALAQGGWYQGEIDGRYGNNTAKAVQTFQQQQDLPANGIASLETWQQLRFSLEPQRIWLAIPSPTAEMLTFTPLVVAQPDPPPSPLWLLLMALIPLLGGGLTYLQHRWQGRKR